jgi:hypothetical protein
MSATIPDCLTRDSAADCREAMRVSLGVGYDGEEKPSPPVAFDDALATILWREARAVRRISIALPFPSPWALAEIACDAATLALNAARPDAASETPLTLDQRGRVLDAARAIVRVAVEVGNASAH